MRNKLRNWVTGACLTGVVLASASPLGGFDAEEKPLEPSPVVGVQTMAEAYEVDMLQAIAQRMGISAEQLGQMTVDDAVEKWNGLDWEAANNARREEQLAYFESVQGLTMGERNFGAQQNEIMARLLGVSIEQLLQMTQEQVNARWAEMQQATTQPEVFVGK